jgi:hypothetical protein
VGRKPDVTYEFSKTGTSLFSSFPDRYFTGAIFQNAL